MNADMKDAIERARSHLHDAVLEGLQAILALIDTARAAGGTTAVGGGGLADEVQSALDAWITQLEQGRPISMPRTLTEPLQRALQIEIDRWEIRSESDDSARPVLRAFLGLRELLWELGMRGRTDEEENGSENKASRGTATPTTSDGPRSRPGKRVQRFHLED